MLRLPILLPRPVICPLIVDSVLINTASLCTRVCDWNERFQELILRYKSLGPQVRTRLAFYTELCTLAQDFIHSGKLARHPWRSVNVVMLCF